MDAIDGDLDLVCNWSNCRATLAVIETTTRPDQFVTYRRGVAKNLNAAFFHIQEVQIGDGSWCFRTLEPASPEVLTMDEWVAKYEVPIRQRHGCRPWSVGRPAPRVMQRCRQYGSECDNDPDFHCIACWSHKPHWWAPCPLGCGSDA
jgi:hypothetical protein